MSYTWTNGEVITAEKLNQTGGGLRVNVIGSEPNFSLDKTYKEIMAAVEAGAVVYIYFTEDTNNVIEPIESMGGSAGDGYGVSTKTIVAIAETLDDYPTVRK